MHEVIASAVRDATRMVHERLERGLPLTKPDLTHDEYRVVVEAFYGFYAPLEASLAAMAEVSDGAIPMGGRRKVGLLRLDLRALGSSDAEVEALPVCVSVPEVTTFGRAFGCLYVVEGATLGGRIIVRALGEHLGIGPATGAAFFEGYGAETGAMWRSFLSHLDASPWPPDDTIAGAVDTFLAFERWLSSRGALV